MAEKWDKIENKDGFYITVNLPTTQPQTAGNYGMFFTAYRSCEIMQVSEVHAVAGSDGGAVTLDIEKLTGTTALGSGDSVLAAEFDLKSTANTVVRKTGVALSANRGLVPGDRLALKDTGALTDLQGIQVTLYFKFRKRGSYL